MIVSVLWKFVAGANLIYILNLKLSRFTAPSSSRAPPGSARGQRSLWSRVTENHISLTLLLQLERNFKPKPDREHPDGREWQTGLSFTVEVYKRRKWRWSPTPSSCSFSFTRRVSVSFRSFSLRPFSATWLCNTIQHELWSKIHCNMLYTPKFIHLWYKWLSVSNGD